VLAYAKQVHVLTCLSTRTHHHYSKRTSLCSYSLLLCTKRRSRKYKFFGLWFDPTCARTDDL